LFFKKVYLQERLCPLTKQDSWGLQYAIDEGII
jgi:hypothetical protein